MAADASPKRARASRIVRPRSARARARNQRVRALIRPDTQGKLPFFCECGLEDCRRSAWLTLQEAGDLIQSGGLILAVHVPRASRPGSIVPA